MVETDSRAIRTGLEQGRVRRVLALRASRIGDLLMTTPALHAFRQRWPDTHVTFLTNRYSEPLLAGNADIDEVLTTRLREAELGGRRGRSFARGLRGRFDLLLALRPRPELASFCERAGIPRLFPGGDDFAGDRAHHVVEQCLRRIEPLGVTGPPGPLRMLLGPSDLEDAGALAPDGAASWILAHPGCDETFRWKPRSSVRRRVWPVARWRELLARLTDDGVPVVLTSGNAIEARWVDRILAALPRPIGATHVRCPPLRGFAALAARADVVITVDTGPLHVATAVGTPVVGLYGPSPVAYTGPWAPAGRAVVLRLELPCAPCQGKDVRCLRNVCMEEIRVEAVLAAVRERMRPRGRSGE